ncbi:MAG: hypothetical protein HY581_05735 [Nitrospirae bacterium]|nr:hypothetical protein [Nitrospirota bacterium]
MRHSHWSQSLVLIFAVILFLVVPAAADQPGSAVHTKLTGVVSKIESGILFVRTPMGLRPRTISPNKADRVGLHEAKKGDELTMWVDAGNVMLDAHKKDAVYAGHRTIMGNLNYADQYWQEIKVSTPEGTERFEVDSLAGSKLSVFQEGTPVTVELDEDNVVIDIYRIH